MKVTTKHWGKIYGMHVKLSRIRHGASIFWSLYGRYKRSLLLLFLLGLLGGVLESFGVTMLIPLLSHVLQEPLPETGAISAYFDSFFRFFGLGTHLRYLLPFIALVFIIRAAVLFLAEVYRARIMTEYERMKRHDLYRALIMSSWPQLSRQKLGIAENIIKGDVSRTTKLLADFTWMQLQITTALVYTVAALTISPWITLATTGAGAAFLLASQPFFSRIRRSAVQIVTLNKSIAHDVNESIVGLKSIKAMGQEGMIAERVGRSFDDFKKFRLRQSVMSGLLGVTAQPASVIFVLIIFAIAFLQPGFHLATFAVVVFLIQRIFLYVDRVQRVLSHIWEGLPFAASVVRFEEEHASTRERALGSRPFNFNDAIIFKNVSFSYQRDVPVIRDISFTLRKGEMLAIIGPSGVGKTTIADLFLRLLTPTTGSITVDGVPLAEISLFEWRKKVGYVAQEPFLLNDTIYNNVAFYDRSISRREVEEALKDAALWGTVKALPQGMDTLVGDRGTALSAGERQRVALARVLVRKPLILVLDEATSALDAESEQAILETLERLRGSVTMVVIAHRLSTVRKADVLMVLEKGRIAECGNPAELLKDKGSDFYRLTRLQEEI